MNSFWEVVFTQKAIKSDCTSIIHQVDRNDFASKWLAAVISAVLHNSSPVSSPCRARGFLFIIYLFLLSSFAPASSGATDARVTWVFAAPSSLLSALFSSYLLRMWLEGLCDTIQSVERRGNWSGRLRETRSLLPPSIWGEKSDLVPPNKAQIFMVASHLFICKNKTTQQSGAN